ncbi:MAG: F0F1 ATP synthase subunit B [Anaerolineales bacterium]|nr:F0F1 ATP synthase subunit B [Anaerolineales bacterium]MCA9967352.1 F0F1 ATP synthase subunit B [Anaerolineales bacterium]MCB8937942.1 F0F1 ATP synthase subunit B [Ardenticatenaceae bacterium]
MDALGINIGYFLMMILLFIILFNVLKGYLYNPIINNLEERKTKIAKGLEDARQAAIARDNADAEAKKIMDEARAQAAQQRIDAAVQAEETANGIKAQAKKEADEIVAAARADAAEERNSILADARGQIAAIAIAAANKVVEDSLDESRQHAIIADFFAKVPADAAKLSGTSGEVTSAVKLTDAEQAEVKKALNLENVTFKVNPALLGGLVVRVGDKVVDSSVASRMTAMRDSLR